MPTGFQPVASCSGRVKLAVGTDDATSDLQVPVGTTAVVAEIMGWQLTLKLNSGKVVTVENTADGWRTIATYRLSGGINEWSIKLKIVYNTNSSTGQDSWAKLPLGAFIKFDLIRHKTSAYGHYGCRGKVVDADHAGADVKGDPQESTITVEGDGLIPSPTFS